MMVRSGYQNVRRYQGGIYDWEIAGYPLEGSMIPEEGDRMADQGASPVSQK
jgi:hypothetical protein